MYPNLYKSFKFLYFQFDLNWYHNDVCWCNPFLYNFHVECRRFLAALRNDNLIFCMWGGKEVAIRWNISKSQTEFSNRHFFPPSTTVAPCHSERQQGISLSEQKFIRHFFPPSITASICHIGFLLNFYCTPCIITISCTFDHLSSVIRQRITNQRCSEKSL